MIFLRKLKKVFSFILCTLFILQQCVFSYALADVTNITGVANSVASGGNTYNISPDTISGSTGFKKYDNFSLGQGDIANLIYSSGYDKFVNLVQNQISINGIINSMLNNNFYNGHAIFVSPNGMIVGSSGVLNVGSLSVYTPSQSTFNTFSDNLSEDLSSLKSDTQGTITINGKIFARDGVQLHASNINIGDDSTSNTSTGIFSGLNSTYNQLLTTNTGANSLFTDLVNTNGLNKGTSFNNVNGKIVIEATSTTTDGSLATSSVNVKNAYLDGNGIDISATSSSTLDTKNSSTITDTIFNDILNGSTDLYTGAVSSAIVNIDSGAKLISSNDINLNSSATSVTTVADKTINWQDTTFSYGTGTTSKVNVLNGSSITTTGKLTADAESSNQLDVSLKSKNSSSSSSDSDSSIRFVIASVINNADTEALLESGSAIKASDLDITAKNSTANSLSAVAEAQMAADDTDPNVGAAIVINNSNILTSAKIDTLINTANQGDININAQTMYISSIAANSGSSKSTDSGTTQNDTQKTQTASNSDKLNAVYSKYTQESDSTSTTQTTIAGSGAIAVNNSNLTTSATIGKNATINADNVSINANTIDLTANQAIASSSDSSISAGVALVTNFQKDSTIASIEDGDISNHANVLANDSLNINATTQMPQYTSSIEFLLGAYQTVGGVFTSDFWDDFLTNAKSLASSVKEITTTFKEDDWKSTLGVPGLFNNYAQSSGSGESAGIAGSIIYSSVLNSTVARAGNYAQIGDNSVKNGDIIINAANDIVYNNMAGVLEALYKPTSGTSGDVGVGGSLIVSSNKHDAKSQIGDYLNINSGDINLNAATKQQIVNIAAGGAGAGSAAVSGSIAVITDSGTTETSVGNSIINAQSLSLNSGSANINGYISFIKDVYR